MSIPIPSRDEAEVIVAAMNAALAAGYSPMGTVAPKGTVSALIKVAEDRGISSHTLRHWVRADGLFERNYGLATDWKAGTDARKAARGEMGFAPVLPGYELARASTQRDASGNTEREWITQKPTKGPVAEVPAGHIVKGVSILTDGEGRQVARWIKTRKAEEVVAKAAIRAEFDSYAGRAELPPRPEVCDADLLTVYAIPDHHLGLYAWSREAGSDYDLVIAESILVDAMSRLVAAAPSSATAIVLGLGDYFHADSKSNQTANSGHALDVDTRWTKVVQTGVKLFITCIDLALTKHDKVTARVLGGNHDDHSSIMLAVALGCFYSGSDRVTIDTDPSRFFYFQHGKVMIAATHGDMVKPNQMAGVVAGSMGRMWGDCNYRYGYQGHIHHVSKFASEGGGMIVETLQTLAAKDAFHANHGYCSNRSLTAITHHREHGEHSRNVISYSALKAIKRKVA